MPFLYSEGSLYVYAHRPYFSIIRSECEDKDLTTINGLTRTLEFETLDDHGVIKATWMEYVKTAFAKVNDRNAKKIVLHLCKNKDRELTRKELLDDLQLDISDEQLELKLEALVKADIISQGRPISITGVCGIIFSTRCFVGSMKRRFIILMWQ